MTQGPENQTSVPFTSSDGPVLIRAARQSITKFLESKKISAPKEILSDPRFKQKLGCFVTLKRDDEDTSLRGCVGFAEPIYELAKALPEAAVYAATEDPRFRPVDLAELKSLLVEISILTKPSRINVENPKDLPSKIQVGTDGLIMKWSMGSGLLLPQVAPEFRWNSLEFLENLSIKAGAPPNHWMVPGTAVYKFQALVFKETLPDGKAVFATK